MLNTLKRKSLVMLPIATALLLTFNASVRRAIFKVVQQELTQLAGVDYWRQVRQGIRLYHPITRAWC